MVQTKSIYIYGSGGHGKVVGEIARLNGYENIIFLDDKKGLKFNKNLAKFDVIIAVGDNKIRAKLQEKVLNLGFNVVSLIHPKAVISKSAVINQGVVVMAGAIINPDAIIEDGVIINSAAVIEHECVIRKFAHISPNSALAGGVTVGEFCHLGLGSSVIQNIKIGKNSVVGAGAVVINNIPSNSVAVGVPAKVIKNLKLKSLLDKESIFIYYESWEFDCCGKSFSVRDKIDWSVDLDIELKIDKFNIELYYDGHCRAINPYSLVGIVKSINKLYKDDNGNRLVKCCINTNRFEENYEDYRFFGYIVEIENFTLKECKE